jgi:uncharacterized protein YjdB
LVSSITIPEGDQSLEVGESVDLSVDITPTDALDQSVTWEVTSGSAYASVDANGLVTANAAGTATITATTNDGSNLSASVEVTVTDIPADGTISVFARMISGTTDKLELIIDNNTIHIWDIVGSSYQEYTYSGLSGTGNLELYFQDNGTDMRIDYIVINGSTTMQAEDQEINEATWQDGSCGGNYAETMYCPGSIIFGNVDFGSGTTPTTYTLATNVGTGGVDVTVNPDQASYDENEQVTLTPNAQGGYSFSNWTGTETGSSNPLVINMTEDENITANFSPILVSSITIPEGDQSLEVGETVDLSVDITPNDALDQSVTWEVISGSSYASVDANGLVTADAAGTATITATANDGSGANASVEVTVTNVPPPTTDAIPWIEDFTGLSDGTFSDNGSTGWTIDNTGINPAVGVHWVVNETLKAQNVDAEVDFMTNSIDISSASTVTIEIDLETSSTMDAGQDYSNWYYKVDGGIEQPIVEIDGVYSRNTVTITGVSGSSLEIVGRTYINAGDEQLYVHSISVTAESSPTTYALTVENGSGDGNYEAGAERTITADNAASGYTFDAWIGDIANVADVNAASTTITMPAAAASVSATYTPILVSSITIPEGDQSLEVGESVDLSVNVSPSDALDQSVTWEVTSGSSYASVDANGLVTALAAGAATITATANDGSNVSGSVEITITETSPSLTLYEAFAFGADSYTTETPNQTGKNYVKVVQNGANFNYDAANGHGYTDLDKLDGSPNNRNSSACGEELYDQFIGVKSGPGDIKFRVDVPNGDYKFVAAMGDASYSHYNIMKVRDGSDGTIQTLISGIQCAVDEYAIVEFDDKVVPACSGATFTSQPESPVLTVTNGYIEVIQESAGNGGDLVLVEIWSLDGHHKSAKKHAAISDLSNSSITVYPNPAGENSEFTVNVTGFGDETSAFMKIYDMTGRLVYMANLNTKDLVEVKHTLSSAKIGSEGMYFISVTSGNKVKNTKLIIE